MYLLILGTVAVAKLVKIQFTSHYVSINSRFVWGYHVLAVYLHPTMYLLIRLQIITPFMPHFDLHPTMYLLILYLLNLSFLPL